MTWQVTGGDGIAICFSERLGARANTSGVDFRLSSDAVRWLALALDQAPS